MTATTTHDLRPDGNGAFVAGDLVRLTPTDEQKLEFRCLKDGCDFHREFGTLPGAMRYITEHMHLMHRVRITWPEKRA